MPSATSNGAHGALSFTTFTNTINGKQVDTEHHRNNINPATLAKNWDVPVATQDDLDKAVDAAKAAFKGWSKTPYAERQAALMAFAQGLEDHKADFAKLLTTEQGKPGFQAESELSDAVNWIRGLTQLDGAKEEVLEDTAEKKVVVRYTPIGVVGAIVPWNFPVQLASGKIAPALVTGNVIIVKPSPFTPYCNLKMAELAQQYFPPGVFQCLSGDDNLGPWMTSHPGIDKISFTGSSVTGKLVMASCSKTLKRVTLELGGKDPAIVCADVDIAATAPAIATLAFFNSGQICLALKRIYIHESIFDEFRDAMVAYTKTLVVGDGSVAGTFCGPIQNSMQYNKVKGFFEDIEKQGQKVAVGGKNEKTGGYYITPTIIEKPADNSKLVTEEPFGPILPILSWSDEEDVISRANNTKMGLGASVWSRNLEEAERIGRQLEAGNIWINTHLDMSPNSPFGGHKESGIGVEWGATGLRGMCNSQTITLKKK